MIPKVINFVWLGGAMPADVKHIVSLWQQLNESFTIKVWDESQCAKLENYYLFERCVSYAGMADVARYNILRDHGGYYVDTDMFPLRSLAALQSHKGLLVCNEAVDGRFMATAFIAAERGRPALDEAVRLCKSADLKSKYANRHTGPFMWRKALSASSGAYHELPVEAFYPIPFGRNCDRKSATAAEFPNSYAVHLWRGSWL